MRVLIALGIAAWFVVWTGAGYELTQDSFSWLKQPVAQDSRTHAEAARPTVSIPFKIPTTKEEAAKIYEKLTPSQRDCLAKVATAEQLAAAEQGKMPSGVSASQMAAFYACLK